MDGPPRLILDSAGGERDTARDAVDLEWRGPVHGQAADRTGAESGFELRFSRYTSPLY